MDLVTQKIRHAHPRVEEANPPSNRQCRTGARDRYGVRRSRPADAEEKKSAS